ncbi:UPAR/Ly6 domain-containing protein crok [Lasioglossum baleicum]|uniref:UPAR/Ly6 domain-containing protein crok n=1 Tax=Lasioglossum baleicum TaxID=434251 RepID=UPI003FCE25A0
MNHAHVFAVCLLLSLGFYGTDAMQCYLCNSHNDSRCSDKIPPDALKRDCADLKDGAKYTMCRKITQVIEFSVNGLPADTRVIRGCGWVETSYKGKCYQRSGFGGRQEVCSCLEDYCNAATPTVPPAISLIVSCVLGSVLLAFIRN